MFLFNRTKLLTEIFCNFLWKYHSHIFIQRLNRLQWLPDPFPGRRTKEASCTDMWPTNRRTDGQSGYQVCTALSKYGWPIMVGGMYGRLNEWMAGRTVNIGAWRYYNIIIAIVIVIAIKSCSQSKSQSQWQTKDTFLIQINLSIHSIWAHHCRCGSATCA